MSFEEFIKQPFEIVNGRFESKGSAWGNYTVQKFGWGGNEYKISGDYSANEYSIDTDAYGDWYLKKGYQEICRLYHLGGENWTM
ncbi:MAG: hypothetical protein IKA43_04920 [Clostridia bacterium]|nr:hypothetical protein [Clostridia bacterium]MBR2296733.1 hypothetical protein [Clostridia bacterium]